MQKNEIKLRTIQADFIIEYIVYKLFYLWLFSAILNKATRRIIEGEGVGGHTLYNQVVVVIEGYKGWSLQIQLFLVGWFL